jgi:hypothetical protein
LGILHLREQGYAPEVICAHLARLGWQAPDDATTLPTLGAAFAVDRWRKNRRRSACPISSIARHNGCGRKIRRSSRATCNRCLPGNSAGADFFRPVVCDEAETF